MARAHRSLLSNIILLLLEMPTTFAQETTGKPFFQRVPRTMASGTSYSRYIKIPSPNPIASASVQQREEMGRARDGDSPPLLKHRLLRNQAVPVRFHRAHFNFRPLRRSGLASQFKNLET